MQESINIHNKQFLISKIKYVREDFKNIYLGNDIYLSYQKNLKLMEIETKFGKCYLVGIAFQVKEFREDPEIELKNIKKLDEINNILSTWSGRYIVILNNKIYMDFAGNLGVFYGKNKDGIFISSSLSLLQEVFKLNIVVKEYIKYEEGMDYYPGPLTRIENVYRLLNSEILYFQKCSYEIEKKIFFNDNYLKLNKDEIYEEFIKSFSILIKNIEKKYKEKIFLQLTGGVDSRTILSFLLKEKINFSTFICEREKGLASSDSVIGNKLAIQNEFVHKKLFEDQELNKFEENKREEEFDKHSLKNCVDTFRYFYKKNMYKYFADKKDSIILRGCIWEATTIYYSLNKKSNNYLEDIENYFYKKEKKTLPILHKDSLKVWIKRIFENQNNLDWRKRFYFEQRVGAWLSSIEQAEDLINIERISPINCEYLINLLWNLPNSETIDKNHQKEIIRRVYPVLLKLPFNKQNLKDKVKIFKEIYRKKGKKYIIKKILNKIGKKINGTEKIY